MDKKELIISLMKLDGFYIDMINELNLKNNYFKKYFYPGGNIKSIKEIVLDYIGIPKDNYNKANEKGYSRKFADDIYFNSIFSDEEWALEKGYEILLNMGTDNGYLSPEYEGYLSLDILERD